MNFKYRALENDLLMLEKKDGFPNLLAIFMHVPYQPKQIFNKGQ